MKPALGFAAALAITMLAGCAYDVEYRPEYVPSEAPPFVAQGKLLMVMPQEQREFVYEGRPSSVTGDFTTLTVPIGAIVQDIAKQVFGQCFAYGVEFVDEVPAQEDYVLAIEGDMQEFVYSYTRVIDQGFDREDPLVWITPEVDISFAVKAFNNRGAMVLEKTYDSGVRAGESYRVTGRPAERINRTLHATLHGLMLQLASDIQPLLLGECEISEIAAR